MTELSFDFDVDGRNILAPLLVPTLTAQEVKYLQDGGEPTDEIYRKAQDFAIGRAKEGKSPFYGEGDEQVVRMDAPAPTDRFGVELPKNLSREALKQALPGFEEREAKAKKKEAEYADAWGGLSLPEVQAIRQNDIPQQVQALRGMEQGYMANQEQLEFAKTDLDGLAQQLREQVAANPSFGPQAEAQYAQAVEQYNQMVGGLNEKWKAIQDQQTYIQKQEQQALRRETELKSQQGGPIGAAWNSVMSGVGRMTSGVTDYLIDAMVELGVGVPEGTDTPEQKDALKKEVKAMMLPDIRRGAKEVLGTKSTTDEYVNRVKEEHPIVGGGLLGLAESAPAMVSPYMAGIFFQVSDAVGEEMSAPEFDGVSENEKLLMKGLLGSAGMALERFGFRNLVGNTGVTKGIVLRALEKAPKNSTGRQIANLINAETPSVALNFTSRMFGAGAAEAETGGLQNLSDIALKSIYDEAKGKDMFKNPKSAKEIISSTIEASLQEAVGGKVMGLPSALSKAVRDRSLKKVLSDTKEYDMVEKLLRDQAFAEAVPEEHKRLVDAGEITQAQADAANADWEASRAVVEKIPEDLSPEQRKEAFLLLTEKGRLSTMEKALVGDRIAAIDEQLKALVQKTDEQGGTTATTEVHPDAGRGVVVSTTEDGSTTEQVGERPIEQPGTVEAVPDGQRADERPTVPGVQGEAAPATPTDTDAEGGLQVEEPGEGGGVAAIAAVEGPGFKTKKAAQRYTDRHNEVDAGGPWKVHKRGNLFVPVNEAASEQRIQEEFGRRSAEQEERSRDESQRLSEEFEARQEEYRRTMPEGEAMIDRIEEKLAFGQRMTPEELSIANEQIFRPQGFDFDADGNLVKTPGKRSLKKSSKEPATTPAYIPKEGYTEEAKRYVNEWGDKEFGTKEQAEHYAKRLEAGEGGTWRAEQVGKRWRAHKVGAAPDAAEWKRLDAAPVADVTPGTTTKERVEYAIPGFEDFPITMVKTPKGWRPAIVAGDTTIFLDKDGREQPTARLAAAEAQRLLDKHGREKVEGLVDNALADQRARENKKDDTSEGRKGEAMQEQTSEEGGRVVPEETRTDEAPPSSAELDAGVDALNDYVEHLKEQPSKPSDEAAQDGPVQQAGATTRMGLDNKPLDDFGEKLEGARKDLPPGLKEEVSDERIAELPLSKVWPANAHENVGDPVAAALAFSARAEVPPKPRLGYKVRRWAATVRGLRDLVRNMNGSLEAMERMASEKNNETLVPFFIKVRLLSQLPRETWGRVERVGVFPNARRLKTDEELRTEGIVMEKGAAQLPRYYRIDPTTGERTNISTHFGPDSHTLYAPNPHAIVTIDGRSHVLKGATSMGPDEVRQVKDLLGNKTPKQDGLHASDFDIRQRRKDGVVFINRKGDNEYRPLKEFHGKDAVNEARAWMKQDGNLKHLESEWDKVKARDNVTKADVRRDENRERKGENRRGGKDVTERMFTDAFGFRGVQFGNWVGQGKGGKERQGLLNEVYDALMDLSDILGIPSQAISLNGTLGLGLGSRGSGKASAHFEPDTLVINLTKTRGAGSLAHEWFHALDNYFSRKRGGERKASDQDAYRRGNYITYRPEAPWVHKVSDRVVPRTSAQLRDELKRRGEWDDTKTLAENADAAGYKRSPQHPEGVRPEVEQAFADLVEALNRTPMAKRASTMDKGRDGYWSRIIERGARSFENYVISKMAQRGWGNDFLANVRDFQEWAERGKNAERYPYLLPEEEAPVVDAFDNLFGTIETKRTDTGTALFLRPHDGASKQEYTGKPRTDRIIKALRGLVPDLSITIAKTQEEFAALVKDLGDAGVASAWGVFYRDANGRPRIVVNPNAPNVANTLFHEAAHPIIAALAHSRPDLFRKFYAEAIKADGGKYERFGNLYKDKGPQVQQEEAMVQYVADILSAIARKEIPVSTRKDSLYQRVKELIQDILAALGWDTRSIDLSKPDNVREFAGQIAKALEKGIKITGLQPSTSPMAMFANDMGITVEEAQRQYDAVVEQYTNKDGTKKQGWMKAPNGKATNLNELQWVQTRTPAFRNWFGDFLNDPENASNVVDANGDPMVVYHGTTGDFDTFDPDRAGQNFNDEDERGMLFSSDTTEPDLMSRHNNVSGGNIMPVFLSLRNPLIVRFSPERAIRKFGVVSATAWFDNDKASIQQRAEDGGHDGIIVESPEYKGYKGATTLVAFSPNQIKSATANTGQFGPTGNIMMKADADRLVNGWYSRLRDAVNSKGRTQPASEWKNWIAARAKEGSFSLEEAKWTGLSDWLDSKGKEKVTPEEVREFLNENRVRVEVVVLDDGGDTKYHDPLTPEEDERRQLLQNEFAEWTNENGGGYVGARPLTREERQELDGYMQRHRASIARQDEGRARATKFSQYQLSGGTNYREIAITIPGPEKYRVPPAHSMGEGADVNRVLHMRLNDRTGPDGEKILFIEELQSDFGQSLRKLEATIDQNFDDIVEKMKADGVLKKRCP